MTVLPTEYPAYASDFRLPVKMTEWMDQIVTHYTTVGVPLPERQYWTIGETAHDCEQACLAVQQLILGTAANPLDAVPCNGPRAVTFTFEVIRCTPTVDRRGQPPGGLEIEVSSVDPVIDMEIMLDLAPYFSDLGQPVVVTIDAIAASGGIHGALGTYTVDLL